ncbi:hypothetical protein [Burkholderia stagnalis]|uniref:hypothetical protein n=1 Tax=Burkholderia stagnalis TaxID=1503054 RepID=UPI0007C66303|nr:hypothetical protein [Burkholderia stagnalis]
MKKLLTGAECHDALDPRIGGGALIGGLVSWPTTSSGEELQLVASLPAKFLGLEGGDEYVSVFSFYSRDDYFLDRITYHGDPEEMRVIKVGKYTQVLFHKKGAEIFGGDVIPAKKLIVQDETVQPYQGSGIGMPPGFLQNENLNIDQGLEFSLQLYSGDFPSGWTDIFGLSDAVAYLFIDKDKREGLFFVQVT